MATVNAEKVTPRIEAYWTWLLPSKYLEIAQEDQNACNSITTLDGAPGCPVIAGQKYKYKMKVPVNSLPITGINVDVILLIWSVIEGHLVVSFLMLH